VWAMRLVLKSNRSALTPAIRLLQIRFKLLPRIRTCEVTIRKGV
jgi:hypothetical protein